MKSVSCLLAAAGLALLSGCISKESTIVRDGERARIEFENEAAARMFYEALSKQGYKPSQAESTTKFEIPIVFEYKRHVTTGPNGAFNAGVVKCDSNRDGRITELEAKIFSEHVKL